MRLVLSLLCLSFAFAAAAEGVPSATPKANITVLVDQDLAVPVASLARAFAQRSQTPLTIVVKPAAEAESEIEQGLEAHVVLTSNSALVTALTEQGLTDVSSTRSVARTQLALVASGSLAQQELLARHISFAAVVDATPGVAIYREAPASEAGKRAEALMKNQEFSADFAPRARSEPSPDEVVAALEASPALGLMLVPDALAHPDLTLLSILPDSLSPPVDYKAVVLASESMEDARQFTHFLQSPPAQAIFSHFGFQPLSRE